MDTDAQGKHTFYVIFKFNLHMMGLDLSQQIYGFFLSDLTYKTLIFTGFGRGDW